MCDTMAIVEAGRVLFAKNSDRDPNEAQYLEWHPRQSHAAGSTVRCTWIEIPQAEETCAILISRPSWLWGAEMGANEHGVVIGNEAVFTNQPYAKTGLTGMDLLRLALERADTAERACEVIAGLLDEYGQGGGCGYENRRFTYHNSFIVADPTGAFVLETAGRKWAVEPIHGARTISNGLTIAGFRKQYSDRLKTRVSACRTRQARTSALIQDVTGVGGLFSILRDHGEGNRYPRYSILNGGMAAPCMHAGGLVATSQTTASWASELRADRHRHWVTATAAPCTSLFKPVSVRQPLELGPPPADVPGDSLWWRHERFHRTVIRDPERLFGLFEEERDAVEGQWLENPPDPCEGFAEHERLLQRWSEKLSRVSVRDIRPGWVRRYWRKREKDS